MKKEKNYYHNIVMILAVVTVVASFVIANYLVEFGNFLACAHVIIYPMSYFLITLYSDRYGEDKGIYLIFYSIIALILTSLLFTSATLVVDSSKEVWFQVDFKVLFSFILAFLAGQYVNLKIYHSMPGKKNFVFLISTVIAITIDSILFTILGFFDNLEFEELFKLVTGEYIISVISIIFYTVGFTYLTRPVEDKVNNEEKPKKIRKTRKTKKYKRNI